MEDWLDPVILGAAQPDSLRAAGQGTATKVAWGVAASSACERRKVVVQPLRLDEPAFKALLAQLGPSLGLWRAAEVAALRAVQYEPPALDLGCGDGLVTALVLSRVEVGLDPDTTALTRAAQRGVYKRLEALPAEQSRLPACSIGTVLSNSVLEHLPRLASVLEMVARVLRPSGRLVFTVPSDAFSSCLLLPFARYAAWRSCQLGHLHLWPAEWWARRLARVGLEVEEVRAYLRRELVRAWDALELAQQIRLARRRVAEVVWHRLPPSMLHRLARWAAGLDLSASSGGGQMIVARKQ